MSNFEIGLISIPVLMTLIFMRMPIGLAMFVVGIAGTAIISGNTIAVMARLKTETYSTFSSYSLSIVPLFLLMGQFATLGGMSTSLFKAAESFLGHRKGGVAMAAIGACAGFGSICGSSLATAATMGQVALPELKRYGYPGRTGDSNTGGGRHAWHSYSAIGGAGDLCNPDRAEYCQAFHGGVHSRNSCSHRLHDHHLDLCAALPRYRRCSRAGSLS